MAAFLISYSKDYVDDYIQPDARVTPIAHDSCVKDRLSNWFVASSPTVTTAQAIAVRGDMIAEPLKPADIAGQIVVLRGDLVGHIEAMRRAPAHEHDNPNI